MAQSFTRKIKRENLIPIWNKATFSFDFYKKIKSSGLYAITGNPYGDSPVRGPGISYESVMKLQEKSKYTDAEKKSYEKMLTKMKKDNAEPGFFKKMFSKLGFKK